MSLRPFAGVLGHPIEHSLSPVIHAAALESDGIDAAYLAFDVRAGNLERALGGLEALGCVGVNVTLPHKTSAAAWVQRPTGEVATSGAANTVLFTEPNEGHNTDIKAIRDAAHALGVDLDASTVLVLGAGGAARGACVAAGSGRVWLSNRTAPRAEALRSKFGVDVVAWDDRVAAMTEVDVVVNATSVGLDGEGSPLPIGAGSDIGRLRAVVDLVYAPAPTPLVVSARAAGALAVDGLEILVRQGAAAYALFWDRPEPSQLMWRVACDATGRPATSMA